MAELKGRQKKATQLQQLWFLSEQTLVFNSELESFLTSSYPTFLMRSTNISINHKADNPQGLSDTVSVIHNMYYISPYQDEPGVHPVKHFLCSVLWFSVLSIMPYSPPLCLLKNKNSASCYLQSLLKGLFTIFFSIVQISYFG